MLLLLPDMALGLSLVGMKAGVVFVVVFLLLVIINTQSFAGILDESRGTISRATPKVESSTNLIRPG